MRAQSLIHWTTRKSREIFLLNVSAVKASESLQPGLNSGMFLLLTLLKEPKSHCSERVETAITRVYQRNDETEAGKKDVLKNIFC